ncbi:hypothetical protein SAMN06269117_11352 [Balnearium lithotrophicum]|uniref:Uncharacterized protein n=1 Tax=Balnearium lithotrophicum TaxID=223788 RepID=A0A521CJU2_9BACT|nr:hypothetical protein SAMN06269117_11352 [Balnearium lithotrophicum]
MLNPYVVHGGDPSLGACLVFAHNFKKQGICRECEKEINVKGGI